MLMNYFSEKFQTGTEPDLVIFFDCPEDEMVKRLLGRNQVGISTSYSSFWAKLH